MRTFVKFFALLLFFFTLLDLAKASSWQIECSQNTCTANYLHMKLSWKMSNSALNGTLESVEGLPIDNEEFNLVIEKINTSQGLKLPKGKYLSKFIQWLGDIGYSQYKSDINRYLAAAVQTLNIYEQNQTDDYICAFLAYNFPQEVSKIDFEINPPNKADETLMFIKYLSFMDKSSDASKRYMQASKAYIYLLQNKSEFNEYFANFKDFVLNYAANLYYQVLVSNINAQLKEQKRALMYKNMAKRLPLFTGLLAIVWIIIIVYIIIDKKKISVTNKRN